MKHFVLLSIEKTCEEKYMTEEEIKEWVEDHFDGFDYGEVRVEQVRDLYESSDARIEVM